MWTLAYAEKNELYFGLNCCDSKKDSKTDPETAAFFLKMPTLSPTISRGTEGIGNLLISKLIVVVTSIGTWLNKGMSWHLDNEP